MKKIILLLLVFQLCAPVFLRAQKFNAKKLETEIRHASQKAYSASVLIQAYDTLKKTATAGMFSGVVIDKDGYILSAAHAVTPDKYYQVSFPDGKTFLAKGMGRIPSNDAAMLRINEQGSWPYAEMGYSNSLKQFEPCISIAYPGSLPQKKPTLRFGYVADVHAKNGFIQTTCLMEPGDSGGPVFDLLGRVIGLHSQIEMGLDRNFEIAVDLYRKYWKSLTMAKSYSGLPVADSVSLDPLISKLQALKGLENINETFEKLESSFDRCTFAVKSSVNGKEVNILATLFDPETVADHKLLKDKSFLISKSSMVGELPTVELKPGEFVQAKIIKRDEDNDLILLQISRNLKNGIKLGVNTDSISFTEIGKFLISPNPANGGQISVLGNQQIIIEGRANPGFLGVTTELKEDQLVFTTIQRRSPASMAKLKVGDQVLAINGVAVNEPMAFSEQVQKYKPEETVKLKLVREGTEFIQEVTLKSRLNAATHIADQFTDGKSERRYGFKNVFVHDSKIKPSECGGPVFDQNGKFYGINIARFSRTSSIAVPAKLIGEFLKPVFI